MTAPAVRDPRAAFLEAVPVFAGLSPEMLNTLAGRASWVRVPAGEWLIRQDAPGDSLYVVRSGRLEILLERPHCEVLRVLTRGAVVGELALITGSPRSASVRAGRDTELLQLERDHFVPLLTEPEFSMALARELGHQLQLSRGLPLPSEALPVTVALVPLAAGAPVDRFCDELASVLGQWKRVAKLDPRAHELSEADYTETLDRCERDNDLVLLVAGSAHGSAEWLDFCLRQADRTLVLTGEGISAEPALHDERLRGCDLLSFVESPSGAAGTPAMETLAPRSHRQVPPAGGFSDAVGWIARRLAGRAVGVVLSGGGARGFAHIGVLDELLSAGVTIDRVGGCSMGAYVGAMFAAGMQVEEMRHL